ncbi:hypothetical protein TESG_07381 [Trichophyton tonsurans CBS 112818]|uniref:Altered inheritance of mitochondria protein 9, mitochondrial n=1 Tax=Trichophyton tonsurans (strain CBS 112818) TaxID=647933 RepID=F2S908_TRIT1|nr:hypothetical protein TESG_07381 [Trichophyton tonsurans CBS 112818]
MTIFSSSSSFTRKRLFQLSVLHFKCQLAAISTVTQAGKTYDYQDEDFFRFTRGRFVSDEAEQLRRRYVKFNVNELAATAAKAKGATKCIDVQKCPDGLYNKAFLLTMDDGKEDDGKEVIGKIPNSNSGPAHLTIASEVATMDFIFKYHKRWTAVKFSQFGSLYYSKDLPTNALTENNPYIDRDGPRVEDNRFAIGPSISREWLQDGREDLQCHRGPWKSLLDYHVAIGQREEMAIRSLKHVPKQCAMLHGPGAYQPMARKKLAAVKLYSQMLEHILPSEAGLASGHLWHNDLHSENIFVNPDRPTEITGIIDWQSIQIAPLIDHYLDPSFLGYEGPDVGEDPQPLALREDIDSLEPDERRAAIKQFYDTSVMVAWRMLVKRKNPDQHAAIRFRKSKAGHMLGLSQNLFAFGEAHFRALVLDLRDEWVKLGKEFPLEFSTAEISEIEADVKAADIGIGAMNMIIEKLGDLWPEKGAIDHENYDVVMAMLRDIKTELIERVVHSPEDRQIFDTFWPFDC